MIYRLKSRLASYLKRQPVARDAFYLLGSNRLTQYLRDKLVYNILHVGRGSNYEWIFAHIDASHSSGKAIIEVGSRDALDAIHLLSNTSCNHAFIFEPSIRNIPICIANILSSPLRDKITFLPIAVVGEAKNEPETGLRLIHFNEAAIHGMSSIYPQENPQRLYPRTIKYHTPGKIFDSYKVPAINLDSLDAYLHQEIFLIVIDVEGAESEVIEGATNLLRRTSYVCIEFSNAIKRVGLECDNASGFIQRMSALGFNLLSTSKASGFPSEEISFQADLLFHNGIKHPGYAS